MSAVVVPISDCGLAKLVQSIEDEHQAAHCAARSAIHHAIRCGELLIQAKADLSHGAWAAWVEAHCSFGMRSAQGYMRLARELPRLDDENAQRVADLSIRDALSAVARHSSDLRHLPEIAADQVLNRADDGARLPPASPPTGTTLQAPFPYFGGKSSIASLVWERLGNVANYVEPFAGSLAVLLSRPHSPKVETVNDKDGFIANFWRACQEAPEEVARWADWPVNEADLHARHYWLLTEGKARIESVIGDPHGCDPKVAGWWLWGICSLIGHGFCSGNGPWQWGDGGWQPGNGAGVNRQIPHLGNNGRGINRQIPHLNSGQGINRLSGTGDRGDFIIRWIEALSDRLREVRVCCGDWSRVCGPTPTTRLGLTGVFLDPPYSAPDRAEVYTVEDFTVARDARAWAIEVGNDPLLRIAFCGYENEFADPWPDGWTEVPWKAKGGYGSQSEDGNGRANAHRERIWFSPHCLRPDRDQLDLFGGAA